MKRTFKILTLLVLGLWTGGSAMAEEHYLVGGATASGWNSGEDTRSPVAMMNVSENVWLWVGKLTKGDGDAGAFKIPNTANDWSGFWAPSAWYQLEPGVEADLSTNGDGDNKYNITETGIYKVTINTSTMKIKAEKLTEPTKDGDNYYQITSVDDYFWFAGSVTSGEQSLKARLTTDLDFSEKGYYPLSAEKEACRFTGEFDGQGHTMSNILMKGSYFKLAAFRSIDGATIKNLKVQGAIETDDNMMGGLVGQSRGSSIIKNIVVDMSMTSSHSGDGTHGGVIAVAWDALTIQNVAFVGSINAPNDNGSCGFIGYAHPGGDIHYTNCFVGGTLTLTGDNNRVFGRNGEYCTNCYTTITNITKLNNADRFNGAEVTASQVASGELAYKLNGNSSDNVAWYQVIGTDAYPIPFGTAVVYANGTLECDGITPKAGTEVTFSNTEGNTIEQHHFNDWGFCDNKPDGTTLCNELNTAFMTPASDGYYEISTKQQLNWFAVRVNGHDTYHSHTDAVRDINGRLKKDIDFSDQSNMIGGAENSTGYQGTFDGEGHSVTLGYVVSQKNVALFRTLSSAHVMNLITTGTLNNEDNSCTGGIFAGSHGASLVENCVSYVSINRTNGGDATIGGIGAYMHDTGKIENCAFYGEINASASEGNGGILGYANGGTNIKLINCLVAPTAYTQNGNSADFARNNPSITNCFKVANDDARLASGEMAWELNGKVSGGTDWYQLIGTDAYPMPFGTAIVYANGQLYCDGTLKPGSAFENEEKAAVRDAHTFNEWGFCSYEHDGIVCDALQPDFAELTNGYYQLGDYKKLNWFATLVNRGIETNAKAQLTADIEMESAFPCVGNASNRFVGEIDGQKHFLKNWVVSGATEKVALVRCAEGGLTLKNMTIDKSCSLSSSATVAGFIADINGADGNITMLNLGNEGTMNGGNNTGGLVGCNFNGSIIIHMTNCYNVGSITASNEGGGLGGWLGNNAVTLNCYNNGTVTNGESFARGNDIQLTNCYDAVTNWPAINHVDASAFADGTVFAALFDADDIWRMEFADPAHPVLYDAAVVLKEDFPNRIVAATDVDLTLVRTTYADGDWETICLPFDLTDTQVTTAFGADTKIAKLNGSEGETLKFITVTAIEAGTPYLFIPTNAITTVDFANVDLVPATTPVTEAGLTFTGILEPTKIAQGDFFIAANNMLTPSDGNGTLKAFRTYFKNEGGNAKMFVVDDVATGIVRADGTVETLENVYTLSGVRVNKPTRGLYIINGKKTVIK